MSRTQILRIIFCDYGERERELIAQAIRKLSIKAHERSLEDCGIALPLKEAWLRGTYEQVIRKVDQVTRATVSIGRRFVNKPPGDKARMKTFYWIVENPHPKATCALDIGLCLVPFEPQLGNLVLTQQVLRLGDDEFAYWGVD